MVQGKTPSICGNGASSLPQMRQLQKLGDTEKPLLQSRIRQAGRQTDWQTDWFRGADVRQPAIVLASHPGPAQSRSVRPQRNAYGNALYPS